MPQSINLLDPSLGIQNVMEMPESGSLPHARELAVSVLREAGLDELYAPVNTRLLTEQALCPDVGDGTVLTPERFSSTLKGCVESLKDVDDPVVQSMINQDLKPLLENGQLLQAYAGLMIGG